MCGGCISLDCKATAPVRQLLPICPVQLVLLLLLVLVRDAVLVTKATVLGLVVQEAQAQLQVARTRGVFR